jgi:hypothetical protein
MSTKKRTAEEVYKAEEAKLRSKTIELELMREAKASRNTDTNLHQSADPAIPGPRHNVTCKGHLITLVKRLN